MNELALFAGAGGGILGGKLLGWRTVCAVEREAYPAAVLAQRQNDGLLKPFPIWSDVTTFDGKPWRGIVDVISGGFPCQAYSNAASGKNIKEKDLWHEMYRIVIDIKPGFVVAENVSREAISKARSDLEGIGYNCKEGKVSSQDMGADHIRARFWLLAYADMCGEFFSCFNAKTQRLQEFCEDIRKADPRKFRMVDGVANRVDRLRAVGNGQDPTCMAEFITEALT